MPTDDEKGRVATAVLPSSDELTLRTGKVSASPRPAEPSAKETGRYLDRGEIARGGMASIRRAFDAHLLRDEAVKILDPGLCAQGGDLASRFLQEAQILAQLDHASIVPVYDLGFDEAGAPRFFRMRLVLGQTFTQVLLEKPPASRDARELEQLLRILVKACEAVSFAHSRGVIHRDLKPDNVMVGSHGQVYVMDWGCALVRPESTLRRNAAFHIVEGDTIVGTGAYMAPEQALGKVGEIDARSDVFSLGAMLYQLLTGRAPYQAEGGPMATLKQAQQAVIAPIEDAIPGLGPIAMRALAVSPQARYQNADELREDIEAFLRRPLGAARPRPKPDEPPLEPAIEVPRRSDVTTWTDPAKVLLVSGLTLPFALGWFLRLFKLGHDPSLSTYISRAFLPHILVFTAGQALAHALLVIVALLVRRRARVPWLAHAEIQLWCGCMAYSLYLLGTMTSGMNVMVLLLPVVGFLLFGRATSFGLVTLGLGVVAGITLPALGLAPYAPLLAHAPYANGKLESTWIASQGLPPMFATVVGIIIFVRLLRRLRERQRELERLNTTDVLTGLANRRVFFERLEEELARSSRHGHALCVIVIDVDDLKSINDAHGHLAGDGVLRELGAKILDERRLGDVAARYGGEEFAILLPHTTMHGARAIADRLLRVVRTIELADRHVTVSIGVAEWAPPEEAGALLARADAALKSDGRDHACAASA